MSVQQYKKRTLADKTNQKGEERSKLEESKKTNKNATKKKAKA